jgi:hypothetical protein
MAEPTYIGRVTVWGLDGKLAYTGLLVGENEPTRLTYTDEIARHDSKDRKGETIGVQLYNPTPKLDISFIPCAPMGVGAIAASKQKVVLPAKGSKVTVSEFPPNVGTAEDVTINSAKWLYLGGGSIDFTNEGEAVINLPLHKFNTDIAQTANS